MKIVAKNFGSKHPQPINSFSVRIPVEDTMCAAFLWFAEASGHKPIHKHKPCTIHAFQTPNDEHFFRQYHTWTSDRFWFGSNMVSRVGHSLLKGCRVWSHWWKLYRGWRRHDCFVPEEKRRKKKRWWSEKTKQLQLEIFVWSERKAHHFDQSIYQVHMGLHSEHWVRLPMQVPPGLSVQNQNSCSKFL